MVTPSGNISLVYDNAINLVAGSATFRTQVGAADAAAAKAFIYLDRADDDFDRTKWVCVVEQAPGWKYEWKGGGSRNYFSMDPSINFIFQAPITDNLSRMDARYEFTNPMGAIIDEMAALAGTAGYFNVTGWDPLNGPQRPTDEERKSSGYDYYQWIWNATATGRAG